jgi:hypothetical protein
MNPDASWSLGPASVTELCMAGPPANETGSIVTAWSYVDQLSIGIVSFAGSMDDPSALGEYLGESLDELVSLARQPAVGSTTDGTPGYFNGVDRSPARLFDQICGPCSRGHLRTQLGTERNAAPVDLRAQQLAETGFE